MRLSCVSVVILVLFASPANSQDQLSSADTAAAFRAAGFKQASGQWRHCDPPQGSVYTPGAIEQVGDLNGDGRPDAIITEGSTFCYGGDEVGFSLVSKQANASWKLMIASPGIAAVLKTKGSDGWPDLEIGGQGFCFPVQRWSGSEYLTIRYEYEGKACRPLR